MFQGFSQDLMMLIGNLMQWKFRMPGIFKKLIRSMTEKAVHDIVTKTDWKDDPWSASRSCRSKAREPFYPKTVANGWWKARGAPPRRIDKNRNRTGHRREDNLR